MTVSQTRYASFDTRYASDFNTMMGEYLAKNHVTVVADYRNHNSHGSV